MKEMKIKMTFTEPILGTASSDPKIHEKYIASNAPDAPSKKEEVEAVGADEVFEKSLTIFPRTEGGQPMFWDYQIKGFFKDACKMLHKVSGTKSSKAKAYLKQIDGLIFVKERKIPIIYEGEMDTFQRPLRGQTAQGERICLASSERIPANATCEFTIKCLVDSDMEMVEEWLDYGSYRGIGQWRNASYGRFVWERVVEKGKSDWRN